MTMAPIKKMPNMPPICALKFEPPNAGPMKRDDVIMHPATIFHFLPLFACEFRLNVRSQAAPPRDWPGLWDYHNLGMRPLYPTHLDHTPSILLAAYLFLSFYDSRWHGHLAARCYSFNLTGNAGSCDTGYAHRFFLTSAGAVLTVLVLMHA